MSLGVAPTKAAMSSRSMNDLPDSDFAYIEPGGTKDGEGKTTPRSLRHFPIHDAAHVRNALSRLSQSEFGSKAKAKVMAAAKRFGIETGEKSSLAGYEASRGAGALSTLLELAAGESDEPDQLAMLERSIEGLMDWINAECAEVGEPDDTLMAVPMKAWQDPMKAEPLTTTQLDEWLAGKRSRRILVVPYGGPLPGGKAGLDLDGDFFDEDTDLYGSFAQLRESRNRLVDWHHDDDPTGVMKGALLGQIVLDAAPEADGLWADFWANAGEKRRNLMAQLEQRGVPLFGSSQAVPGHIRKSRLANGTHIDTWPLVRHTITTSPQNTFAAVPPLKAILQLAETSGAMSVAAIKAAALGDGAAPWTPSLLGTAGAGNVPGNGASSLPPHMENRLNALLEALAKAL